MPRPFFRQIGSYRIAYQPVRDEVPCPCGEGTIVHCSRYYAGGRDEPPSEEYDHSQPCEACGCDDETQCDHQPAPDDE